MKFIRRCEGNYISESGKYIICKSGWDGTWKLSENGKNVGYYLTKREAQEEAEKREKELIRELGELEEVFSLCDKSPENIARGQRIREIKKELGLDKGKPRQAIHPAKVVNR